MRHNVVIKEAEDKRKDPKNRDREWVENWA